MKVIVQIITLFILFRHHVVELTDCTYNNILSSNIVVYYVSFLWEDPEKSIIVLYNSLLLLVLLFPISSAEQSWELLLLGLHSAGEAQVT